MDFGIVEGVGALKFNYEWSVEGFAENKQTVIDMLKKASTNKRRAVLKWSDKIVSRHRLFSMSKNHIFV